MEHISKFTPWQTSRDQLESIFIAREPILDDLTERAIQVADTDSRIHTLVAGPRGAGKTHLLAMLYYRLTDAIKGGLRVQVANLPEDPITIISYSRLLAAIIERIRRNRPKDLNDDKLEFSISQAAKESGPIVVLLENLDEVFVQIGIDGQRKLRHLLQTTRDMLFVATTSILDRRISDQASPFYSFFSVIRLQPLSVKQAQQMLISIAIAKGEVEIAEYLGEKQIRNRLEIVSQLVGSHPGIWSIFSNVMTTEGLGHIAGLLYSSLDDLKPHYIDRLKFLNPQQRLVVNELASADRPLHVQDIAKRAYLAERSAARTIGELKETGWLELVVTPWSHLLDGRRAYYELSEPLVRLAYKTKEAFGRPIESIVSFLSVWFDPEKEDSMSEGLLAEYMDQPGFQANDVVLLGDVDDALAHVQAGDAEAIMALPSQVRKAIERRCKESSVSNEQEILEIRRILNRDAMNYMGWVAHEPQSSEWVKRGENLASITSEDKDISIWSEWLARSWHFEQAETVLNLIENDSWSLTANDNLAFAYLMAGNPKRAIPIFEKNLAGRERILGSQHPDTLRSRDNLLAAKNIGRKSDTSSSFKGKSKMENKFNKETTNYLEDAMTKQVCLICGERLGDYSYLSKSVCPECLEYIRTNY